MRILNHRVANRVSLLLSSFEFSVNARHYDDKAAEAANGYWNCPCVPMRERKECHCMLFLTEENDFAGKEQAVTIEEIRDAVKQMSG